MIVSTFFFSLILQMAVYASLRNLRMLVDEIVQEISQELEKCDAEFGKVFKKGNIHRI